MVFTRNLTFTRGDIGGGSVTLLLCFQVPNPDRLYVDQFSVAWRVITFVSNQTEEFDATYRSQLFFTNPQIDSNNIVKPARSQDIDPGQRTVLYKDDYGQFVWSTPEKVPGNLIHAMNDTGSDKDIGIGIWDGVNKRLPIIVFNKVANGLSATANFEPLLLAYVTSDYKESGLLRGAIQSQKPIWTQNLLPLDDQTNWVFLKDPITKSFTIRPAN